jgi:hypothetical protein
MRELPTNLDVPQSILDLCTNGPHGLTLGDPNTPLTVPYDQDRTTFIIDAITNAPETKWAWQAAGVADEHPVETLASRCISLAASDIYLARQIKNEIYLSTWPTEEKIATEQTFDTLMPHMHNALVAASTSYACDPEALAELTSVLHFPEDTSLYKNVIWSIARRPNTNGAAFVLQFIKSCARQCDKTHVEIRNWLDEIGNFIDSNDEKQAMVSEFMQGVSEGRASAYNALIHYITNNEAIDPAEWNAICFIASAELVQKNGDSSHCQTDWEHRSALDRATNNIKNSLNNFTEENIDDAAPFIPASELVQHVKQVLLVRTRKAEEFGQKDEFLNLTDKALELFGKGSKFEDLNFLHILMTEDLKLLPALS